MKARLPKWRLMAMLTTLSLLLSGCGEPFLSTLQPAGEVAQTQYDLMVLSTLIMVGVIVVVTIIYAIAIIRFRRKKGDENKIPKQVEGSHTLELVWTIIPIILLLILAVPTVAATFKLADTSGIDAVDEEGNKEALVVNVRANLYWWEFEYPDLGIVTAQDLIVPTDEKVYFNIEASDVKHSFWIPAAGGKIDANVDGVNTFYLEFDDAKANEAGNLFYGKCTELCGPSHAIMDFKVKALDRTEFNEWTTAMQNSEETVPTSKVAQQGQEIFQNNCLGCHATSSTAGAGAVGPNLANFGERTQIAGWLDHDKETLKDWIKNPQTLKPGNKMPGFEKTLNDQELEALSEYLMGLKVLD
ncbi:cytochrome c oxidase subunit II [Bacillus sp. 2205SS5-2]|uniref:cytochrome c oxidase subunit II n=1 Tax=Bacillus sp. 2205SS5-2 TaxID=3109031 RepID=UPI0030058F4F